MNKIFGIGLPETANRCLHDAMGVLNFTSLLNPKHYWQLLHMGIYTMPDDDSWDCLCHFGMRHYRRLDKAYPDSKFILTMRNKKKWLVSCEKQFKANYIYDAAEQAIRIDIFGTTDFDIDQFSDIYDAHFFSVMEWFKTIDSGRWLLLDIFDNPNWGGLCSFLHVDGPVIPVSSWPQPEKAPGQRSKTQGRSQ